MSDAYVVSGMCAKRGSTEVETHIGLYVAGSEDEARGMQAKYLQDNGLVALTNHVMMITAECQTMLEKSGKAYPTMDAYLMACRAEHWRTAQLKAHGIKPINLNKVVDLTHYPPEDFDFKAFEVSQS